MLGRKPREAEAPGPAVAGVMVISSDSDEESGEDTCPVCDETFVDISVIHECSVSPGDLDKRHCFKAIGIGKMLIIEHEGNGQTDDGLEEEEAVEIEVN